MKYDLLSPDTTIDLPLGQYHVYAVKSGHREEFISPKEIPTPGQSPNNQQKFLAHDIQDNLIHLYAAGYRAIRVESNCPPTRVHKIIGIEAIIIGIEQKERKQERAKNRLNNQK